MNYPCVSDDISIISKERPKESHKEYIPEPEQSFVYVRMGGQQRRPYPSQWQNPDDTMVHVNIIK
jgi:hypothetical protein